MGSKLVSLKNENYTLENYKEDCKLLYFTLHKFFKNICINKTLYSDVFAYVISYAPHYRLKFDISKNVSYATYIVRVFRSRVGTYFRFGNGLKHNKILKGELQANLSLDYEIGDDDGTFANYIASNDDVESNINYETLKKYIELAKQKNCLTKFGKIRKADNISAYIDLFIEGYSFADIGRKFNVTRELIRLTIEQFKTNLKYILIENNYVEQNFFKK